MVLVCYRQCDCGQLKSTSVGQVVIIDGADCQQSTEDCQCTSDVMTGPGISKSSEEEMGSERRCLFVKRKTITQPREKMSSALPEYVCWLPIPLDRSFHLSPLSLMSRSKSIVACKESGDKPSLKVMAPLLFV